MSLRDVLRRLTINTDERFLILDSSDRSKRSSRLWGMEYLVGPPEVLQYEDHIVTARFVCDGSPESNLEYSVNLDKPYPRKVASDVPSKKAKGKMLLRDSTPDEYLKAQEGFLYSLPGCLRLLEGGWSREIGGFLATKVVKLEGLDGIYDFVSAHIGFCNAHLPFDEAMRRKRQA